MKGMLLGNFFLGKLHSYVLRISRDKLVQRLLTDSERCRAPGPPPQGRPPAVGARSVGHQRATAPQPQPSVAWTAALRQQVRWVTRQLVSSLVTPSSRLLSHQCKDLARRLLFSGGTRTLVAFVGITLTGDDGLVTKADRMEVLCSDIKKFVQTMQWLNDDCECADGSNVQQLDQLDIGEEIAKGCNAVVYKARIKDTDGRGWNLAVKMMFNYDAESNASSILRAMYREVVPAPFASVSEDVRQMVARFGLRLADLPSHRNLVSIRDVFVDRVPLLAGAVAAYPAALPPRLHPAGAGRNASLFVVMKRYDDNLRHYLETSELSAHTRLLLLSQLLEGVAHLGRHRVVHRDLKTDNVLVDLGGGRQQPRLVIADFGCCLAEPDGRLAVPFNSWDVDRGGNVALMPPEIAAGRPGRFAWLDFSQADVWAVGAIAHEILGGANPFYGADRLDSVTYAESELPPLPEAVPPLLRLLVAAMLRRSPAERVSASTAATVCQLLLWAPKAWLAARPSHQRIKEWLLTLTAKVMCEWRAPASRDDRLEHVLVHTFLCRLTYAQLEAALDWLQLRA
ncbi:serine/threonine-protein kinase PINK1, mitochondrial-like isoform X2 [Pollicipes pollicipes]|nr:serine/threonine-protein kinase PINK1, mitochondrial-like isoform X2 [Pollicipes pollicipes]